MTDDTPDDLDHLMSIDPLELSTLPGTEGRRKLDQIITYQRKQRTLREAGVKPRKAKSESAPAVQLSELLASLPKPEPVKPKRRM
jgi:hypothetical protein